MLTHNGPGSCLLVWFCPHIPSPFLSSVRTRVQLLCFVFTLQRSADTRIISQCKCCFGFFSVHPWVKVINRDRYIFCASLGQGHQQGQMYFLCTPGSRSSTETDVFSVHPWAKVIDRDRCIFCAPLGQGHQQGQTYFLCIPGSRSSTGKDVFSVHPWVKVTNRKRCIFMGFFKIALCISSVLFNICVTFFNDKSSQNYVNIYIS